MLSFKHLKTGRSGGQRVQDLYCGRLCIVYLHSDDGVDEKQHCY